MSVRIFALIFCFVGSLRAATFVVTNAADVGVGTLRSFVAQANTTPAAPHVITFSLASPYTISISNQLAALTNNTRIDGTTQPGYTGVPIVRITGTNQNGSVSGIALAGRGSGVRGLRIERFGGAGILVNGISNRVEACHVISNFYAISISVGSFAFVGGTEASNRNIIAGSTSDGILINSAVGRNTIQGNYIGVGPTGVGVFSASNNLVGISLQDSPSNQIGGASAGAGNLISGNMSYGIFIVGSNAIGNVVEGNRIGLDATGTNRLGNVNGGIQIYGAPSNRIGGAEGGRNFICGHNAAGVVFNLALPGNLIWNNYIGVATNGLAVSNACGVLLSSSEGSIIRSNLISGNAGSGVWISGSGSRNNQLFGNIIGLDPSGSSVLSNAEFGVFINDGASSNTIGHTSGLAADRNIISGNGDGGIGVYNTNTTGNVILNCLIGTDRTGLLPRPNLQQGVLINEARGTRVGDSVAGRENLISGNQGVGIRIIGSEPRDTQIENNFIGLDINGSGTVGTGQVAGVSIQGGSGHRVGPGMNVISGNRAEGVLVTGYSTNILIMSNRIGCVALGTAALPNGHGVSLRYCGSVTIRQNVISGNDANGIYVYGPVVSDVAILGNLIGLNAAGNAPVANQTNGIQIVNVPGVRIGSIGATNRNVISGNGGHGVALSSEYGSTGTVVVGNYIGLNAGGTASIPNNGDGVYGYYVHGITVGGPTTAHRNVISGNERGIYLASAVGWSIANNYIGLDTSATVARSNRAAGIHLENFCASNVVENNVIGGNNGPGMRIETGCYSHTIRRNTIGCSPVNPLQPLANRGPGILAVDSYSILYGGLDPADGNRIAFNEGPGIAVTNAAYGLRLQHLIYGNLIYSNASIGIDLNLDGITTNDPAPDIDNGLANDQPNTPVLDWAVQGTPGVRGSLVSSPTRSYRVELFSLISTQGMAFLGATNIVLPASGTSAFSYVFSATPPTGAWIIATATTTNDGTSEFSQPVEVLASSTDLDGDGMPNGWENTYGLSPVLSNAVMADADADGVPDLQEWVADTAPDSSLSYFRVSAITSSLTRIIIEPTSTARVYGVESSLLDGSWTPVQTNILGTGTPLEITDPALPWTTRVYRGSVRIP